MLLKNIQIFPLLCLLFVSACEPAGDSDTQKLYQLFEEEWQVRLEENPALATSVGDMRYNDRLPSVTPADHERRAEQDQAFLERLHGIDTSELSDNDRLNYNLFEFVLIARVEEVPFRTWRIPFLSDNGFYSGVVRMSEGMPFKTVTDYENYISRLNDLPRYFGENIDNMRTGLADGFTMPRAILDGVEPQIAVQLHDSAEASAFYAPFKNMPASMAEEDKARLAEAGRAAVEDKVLPAYRALHTFFVGEYMPGARQTLGASALPDGDAYYAQQARLYTTLDLSPQAIHQIGLNEVARIKSVMEEIIENLSFDGSFADFLEFLRTDPRFYASTKKELLAEASYISKRIDGQMPAFFGNLPRLSYGVRAVPDDIAPNYTTGRYWGGSLENGKAGYFMVNTYALDKRPLYALPSLALHEGVPGHHHQISLAQEQEGVPDFRKRFYLSAFGEGWGLYTEKLGVEMGIYEDDYQNFGRLTYEMWRAGRLVVDTGIHSMGWSREQAVQLFVENSALSLHNINTEVDRYISWPGQALAYKLGELKILELRAKAEEALGENFDIRAFHDAILANGSLPLSLLEVEINRFISENR